MPTKAEEYLAAYATGWTEGDVGRIRAACHRTFEFHDTALANGVISQAEFPAYLTHLKELVRRQTGGTLPSPFMVIDHVVIKHLGRGRLIAGCHWAIPQTSIAGTGLISVSSSGVMEERVHY